MDAGIYKILNTVNNKCYIGQSINISKRWKAHLFSYKKGESHLHNAMRKYGIQSFIFQIEEKTDDAFFQLSTEDQVEVLDTMEKWYIFVNRSSDPTFGYNETLGGVGGRLSFDALRKRNLAIKKAWEDPRRREEQRKLATANWRPFRCTMLGRRHSEESIQRMKHSHNGYTQRISEERKKQLADAKRIRMNDSKHYTDGVADLIFYKGEVPPEGWIPGRPQISETTREKISAATRGGNNPRAKPVIVLETQEVFSCVKEVALKYKVNYVSLAQALRQNKTYKGITIRFIDK